MLTIFFYIRYAQNKAARTPQSANLSYALALVFFALGLLSKSMLVTLPVILLLLDYWPLQRLPKVAGRGSSESKAPAPDSRGSTPGSLILEKTPFFLLSAAAGVATVLTQKNAVLLAQGLTVPWRVGNALLAYTDYLGHMFYPMGLAMGYPHPGTDLPAGKVGLAALLVLGISAAVVAGRRRHPCLLVGWLWYLVMLMPVIDIMQAGTNARADRYTYLPDIGMYILVAWGVVELSRRWRYRRVMLGLGAGAILAGLMARAYVQTGYWKDSETLWRHALACTGENALAHNHLGNALVAREQWAEAVHHLERALQIKPDYAQAHLNLGVALANQDKHDEAILHFERALQLSPRLVEARYNIGDALVVQGKWEEAIPQFERALQLKPDYAAAHYDLGFALAAQGKWEEAIRHYEQALHLKLDYADARYISGVAFAAQREWEEAIAHYEGALQVKPDFAEARYRLGVALASQGKPAEAMSLFQQALALAKAQGNTALAKEIQARIDSNSPALSQPRTP